VPVDFGLAISIPLEIKAKAPAFRLRQGYGGPQKARTGGRYETISIYRKRLR
jgi:hypothetical protein